jgi:hypothetical protein
MPWFTRAFQQKHAPGHPVESVTTRYESGRRWEERTVIGHWGGEPIGPSGNRQLLDFLNRNEDLIQELKLLDDTTVMYRAATELE